MPRVPDSAATSRPAPTRRVSQRLDSTCGAREGESKLSYAVPIADDDAGGVNIQPARGGIVNVGSLSVRKFSDRTEYTYVGYRNDAEGVPQWVAETLTLDTHNKTIYHQLVDDRNDPHDQTIISPKHPDPNETSAILPRPA